MSSLLQCHGIGNYTIVVHLDGPENGAVAKVLEDNRSLFKELIIVKNSNHIGCNENTKQAIAHGMELSDYVIHIEDDVVPARDALKLLEWVRDVPKKENVYSATMWKHQDGWSPTSGKRKPDGVEGMVSYSTGVWVWGWSTWKDKWNVMSSVWTTGDDKSASWDTWLCEHLPKPVLSINPMVSRSNNIGAELGTHRGSYLLNYWALSHGFVEPKEYRLV